MARHRLWLWNPLTPSLAAVGGSAEALLVL